MQAKYRLRSASLAALLIFAPLAASCGTPEGETGTPTLEVKQSAVAATSLLSHAPRFSSPGTAKGDVGVALWGHRAATLKNGGDSGYTTMDLDGVRPATLQPINFGSNYDGNAAEWGDFDGDGIAELVLGTQNMAAVDDVPTGGFIVVHFTTTGAFSSADFIRISADATATFNPSWGHALAVGDFNGDGYDDMAIGGSSNRVRIYRGSGHGLVYKWNTTWTGYYGERLAAGDFNCDGYEDLAIAAPERGGDGMIAIYTGTTSNTMTYQFALRQGSGRASGDNFGGSLAVGNFNGDTAGGRPCADLAVGITYKTVSGIHDAGSVQVYYGANTTAGLDAANYTLLHEDVAGVPSSAGDGELFGWQLVASDFNADGVDDLAAHIYMDVNFTDSPCEGDAGLIAFAGKAGVGIQPNVNTMLQLPGPNGRIGAPERGKLNVVTFYYSDTPGMVCPPTMMRLYTFRASSSSSIVISGQSHYAPGALEVDDTDALAGALTHPHAGYLR